ncbi:MAG: GNAT family N-acetyltransferase [Pseudobdellovibrionaceae bacterium]
MSEIQIQLISAEQTWPLRLKVLRPHQTLKDCIYPQDHWPSTFHVGAFRTDHVVGVATFHEEESPHFRVHHPYRLRGMATDFSFHSQGIGRKVLEKAFFELRLRECDFLWCNAREVAFPFYEKLGFQYFGPLFDIHTLGPHKIMYRSLL